MTNANIPVVGALTSGVLSADPYNFSSGSIGLTFLGPLIGCVIGAIAGGWIVDRHALRQARKHGGVSEPEYKLKLFLIPGVLLPIAQLMVGLGPYYGAHWSVFVLGELLSNLGGPLATLLVIVYAFDSFHSIDPDDASGVRASAQDAAPYMMALIFLGMCVTFAFVSRRPFARIHHEMLPSASAAAPATLGFD
jgi:MFS family permease